MLQKAPSKLVLFDIDLTLITTAGAGVAALNSSFRDIFGIEHASAGYSPDGKTDILILRELLRRHGRDPADDAAVRQLLERYLFNLRAEMEKPARGRVNPGIREILSRLEQSAAAGVGLLTGNVREGAYIKLQPYGIARYFAFGAFGDDVEDRNRLLPVAVRRAEEFYQCNIETGRNVFVVGDTPYDIAAAKPYAAVSIAVATGHCTASELQACGPAHVFEDFSDYERFLEIVGL